MVNANLGIVAQDKAALKALLVAVGMVGVVEPPAVPRGELGGCVACGHTVASHFGSDNRWLGCLKGDENTVYILMPAPKAGRVVATAASKTVGHTNGTAVKDVRKRATRAAQDRAEERAEIVEGVQAAAETVRTLKRAIYRTTLHHKASPAKLGLAPTRTKVLETIQARNKVGVRARDIIKRAKLVHGSVQQTLDWLRHHDAKQRPVPKDAPTALVIAEEDHKST